MSPHKQKPKVPGILELSPRLRNVPKPSLYGLSTTTIVQSSASHYKSLRVCENQKLVQVADSAPREASSMDTTLSNMAGKADAAKRDTKLGVQSRFTKALMMSSLLKIRFCWKIWLYLKSSDTTS